MTQRILFWLLLFATVGYAYFMKQAVAPLTSKEIVAYELSKTPDRADEMILTFGETRQIDLVRKSLYLDFVFLLLDGSVLFVGCQYAVRLATQVGAQRTWVRIGYGLAWLGIVALVADIVENVLLLRQLPPGSVTVITAEMAWAMASLKFISIIVVLMAALAGFGYYGVKRLNAPVGQRIH